ncbi:MAG: winged helix-turn-helix domain-containing protein, partial [Acidobacteria bacterium]|nr:winged helix-turn-helix domain-containing protein [Acidobacteriota bacterium]
MDGGFRLGPWRVLPRLGRLEGPEGSHQLEPKMMAVLLELARRSGEPVSNRQLLEGVWGGEAVSESVSRRAVYELRKVLGDDPEKPRFIETLPRIGYRLVAEV